jgi:hypothetical protein
MSLGDIIESGLRQKWQKPPLVQHKDMKRVGFVMNEHGRIINARMAERQRKTNEYQRRKRGKS